MRKTLRKTKKGNIRNERYQKQSQEIKINHECMSGVKSLVTIQDMYHMMISVNHTVRSGRDYDLLHCYYSVSECNHDLTHGSQQH